MKLKDSDGNDNSKDFRYTEQSSNALPNINHVTLDDYRREPIKAAYDQNLSVSVGSTRFKFTFLTIINILFICGYIISLFFIYSGTKRAVNNDAANAPKAVEGSVKQLSTTEKKVETSDLGSARVLGYKKVYIATYNFDVDGVTYSGEFESIDEVKLRDKVVVVYEPLNPNENHLQTDKEANARPKDYRSIFWLKFLCAAIVEAGAVIVIYIKLRIQMIRKFGISQK